MKDDLISAYLHEHVKDACKAIIKQMTPIKCIELPILWLRYVGARNNYNATAELLANWKLFGIPVRWGPEPAMIGGYAEEPQEQKAPMSLKLAKSTFKGVPLLPERRVRQLVAWQKKLEQSPKKKTKTSKKSVLIQVGSHRLR